MKDLVVLGRGKSLFAANTLIDILVGKKQYEDIAKHWKLRVAICILCWSPTFPQS